MSAIQPILDFAKTHRDAHALEHGNRTISYGELADSIRGTANHLKSLGLKTGDRIGVCLKDTPDHLVALLSVAYMGGVSVSLDWRARLQENLRFVGSLQLSGVLVEPEIKVAELIAARLGLDPDDEQPAVIAAAFTGAIRVACQRWSRNPGPRTFAEELRGCLTVLSTPSTGPAKVKTPAARNR